MKEATIFTLTKDGLKKKLKTFLEAYMNTKILDLEDGSFIMYIRLSHTKNTTPKQKLINYKLLRVQERLFEEPNVPLEPKNAIICEFLIDELCKYVSKSIKK